MGQTLKCAKAERQQGCVLAVSEEAEVADADEVPESEARPCRSCRGTRYDPQAARKNLGHHHYDDQEDARLSAYRSTLHMYPTYAWGVRSCKIAICQRELPVLHN